MAVLPGATTSEVGILIATTADTAGITETDAALGEMQATLNETAAEFDAAQDSMLATMREDNAMMASYYQERVAMAEESAAGQDAAGGAGAVGQLGSGAAGAVGMGGIASKLSNPYVLAGAAIAGGLAVAIKSFDTFQQQVVKLYNTAGETTPLQQLDAALLKISNTTGEDTTALTGALYYISSAGYTAAGGLDVLKASAEGAKEENADLTTVANALTTVMHDYGASTSQSTQYMDMLLAAVSTGKMTLQEFSSSLSTVLPIAHNVGLSFAEIAGSLSTLTASGISADQSTQDLRAIIQSLETPTQTEVKNMQQYSLSAVDLAQNLGKEGLAGTLQEVTTAITQSMGPSGLIIQQTLQNATVATADMNKELSGMPPQLKSLATQLMNGTLSFTQYRTQVRDLPEGLTNLGVQFENTYNQANSFNQLLKSGQPDAQTYEAALKGIFGQSDALQGVLALTGSNASKAKDNIKKVGDASKSTSTDVSGWATQQKTMNQQLSDLKDTAKSGAIEIGEKLAPAVTTLAGDLVGLLNGLGKVAAAFDKAWGALSRLDSEANNNTKGLRSFFQGLDSGAPKVFGMPLYASGTNYAAGGMAMVGESGPELVNLPQGSQVLTNSQTNSAVKSGSTNNNSITIGTIVLNTPEAAQELFRQMNQDIMNLGKGLTAVQGAY